ncbi:hypothetical protein [Nocardia thailandica]
MAVLVMLAISVGGCAGGSAGVSGPGGDGGDTRGLFAVGTRTEMLVQRGETVVSRTPAEFLSVNDQLQFTRDGRYVIWAEGVGDRRTVVTVGTGADPVVRRFRCSCDRVVPLDESRIAWVDAKAVSETQDVLVRLDLAESAPTAQRWRVLDSVVARASSGVGPLVRHSVLGSRTDRVLIGRAITERRSDVSAYEVFTVANDGSVVEYGPLPEVSGRLVSGRFEPGGDAVAVAAENVRDHNCGQAVVSIADPAATGFRATVPQPDGCVDVGSLRWEAGALSIVVVHTALDDGFGTGTTVQRWHYDTQWSQLAGPVDVGRTRDDVTIELSTSTGAAPFAVTLVAEGTRTRVAEGAYTFATPDPP